MSTFGKVFEDRPVCLMGAEKYIPEGDFGPKTFERGYRMAVKQAIDELDLSKPEDKQRKIEIEDMMEFLMRLVRGAGIKMRYTIFDDWVGWFAERDFAPSPQDRMFQWRKHAPRMIMEAVNKMMDTWQGDKDRIKHVVAHSVTGFDVPGLAHHIIYNLELPESARAVPVNYVGCQGGMTILYVATAIARSHQDDLVVAATAECCTIMPRFFHRGMPLDKSGMLPMMLFGDSAAATLVGRPNDDDVASAKRSGFALWELVEFGAQYVPGTFNVLRIKVSEDVHAYYDNIIGKELPIHLNQEMTKNFTTWLDRVLGCSFDDLEFAVHPGGRKLLDNFAKLVEDLGVADGQAAIAHCSSNIEKYGNLASSAILVILSDLCRKCKKDNIYMMAMGPGIGLEYGGMKRYNPSTWKPSVTAAGSSNNFLLVAIIVALIGFILSGATINDYL